MIQRCLFTFLLLLAIPIFAQEFEHTHLPSHALIENKGQWDSQVLFQSKQNGQNLWIQEHGFVYDLRDYSSLQKAHLGNMESNAFEYQQATIIAEFVGSNTSSEILKTHKTPNYFNYFLGNDRSSWVSDVHGFGEVTLVDFYKDIDLKLMDDDHQFKYEFWCEPNSNLSQIALDIKGATNVEISKSGELIITTPLGKIIEEKPIAFELLNGKKRELSCTFVKQGSLITFKLGNYNPNATIIIDPVLVFATYCGSITDNFGMTATYGYDGTAYSAGTIYGNAYPTPDNSAYNVASSFTVPNISGSVTTDAFISKYSPDGSTMLWTTFLGGGDNTQGTETANSLICDRNNNICIFGATSSIDFPIVGGFQATHGGGTPLSVQFNGSNFGTQGTDIFAAKISSNGQSLLSSTYIGGDRNDGVNFKISSGTYSSVAAYDSLTTNYGDQFRGEIMIDSNNNIIIASCSWSANFPTQNAFQSTKAGLQDGVVFKLSSDMSSLVWSSYFGGSNNDACYSVKLDSAYNVIIGGGTSSSDLSNTSGGLFPAYQGGKADGFLLKLPALGTSVTQASYIGTSNYDQVFFVEINRINDVYCLGQSVGGIFPVVNAVSDANSGQFLCRINPTLSSFINSRQFGNGNGAINISPSAFLVDICGNLYVSGWGANILQPAPLTGMVVTPGAFQSTSPNGFDFYLAVYSRDFNGQLYGSYLGGSSASEHVDGGTSRFDKNGVVYQSVCGGCGGNSDFPTTAGAWSSQNLSANCNNLVFKFDFELLPNAEFLTDNVLGCEDFTVTFDNFSSSGDSYVWNFGNGDTSSIVFNPTITYDVPGNYMVTLTVTDSICLLTDTAVISIQVLEELQLQVNNDTSSCDPFPFQLIANSFGTATTFHWSTEGDFSNQLNASLNDSTVSVVPTETTTYYVKISNGACELIDSVQAVFVGGSLDIIGDDSLCRTESSFLTASISVPGVSFVYSWSPVNLTNPDLGNTTTVSPITSSWVYVTATGNNGCTAEDSSFVYVSDFTANVVANTSQNIVIYGDTVTLTATPTNFPIVWSPSLGVLNPLSHNTEAVVTETTVYTATISDGVCTKSDTVKVLVLETLCDNRFVYVPNAFSPNGDGENDVLFIRSAIVNDIEFRIFNRWGEMIFETYKQELGWDGTFRGKLVDPDTYDYYLRAVCVQGEEKIIKGNITLLR